MKVSHVTALPPIKKLISGSFVVLIIIIFKDLKALFGNKSHSDEYAAKLILEH